MCGIGGWLGQVEDEQETARAMATAMRHRGPDAQDWHIWEAGGLVHDRLSIIDLSQAGNEPMPNESQTVWTVFNGEIYNHRSLRAELESRGHVFRSRSDTEVIPHLYEEVGACCVERLRGMFAFAVLDLRSRLLLLARDRFGIKPLYYARGENGSVPFLAFASEIGALRSVPGISCQVDPQAISDFLALSFIPPPGTFFRSIRSLEPGQMLEVELVSGAVVEKRRRYHRWTVAPDASLTLESAARHASQLIASATASQLESDVPLGALLSGGIDSGLVTSFAQESLAAELSTFTVRFAEDAYDESATADLMSRRVGTRHTVLDMAHVDVGWDAICSLLTIMGQPYADTSIFAVHAVSELMRPYVTVALSGDGGDEGFGGYGTFAEIGPAARFLSSPAWTQRILGGALVACGRLPRAAKVAVAARDLIGAGDSQVLAYLLSWIRPAEHRRLMPANQALGVERLFEAQWPHDLPPGASRLEELSALATEVRARLIMAGDYLPKVDGASMREGLEVRVPLLDEDLFGFGLTLPHRLKVRHRVPKPVLRDVAARRIGADVARLPKHGFAVPVDGLLGPSFKSRLRETLLGPSAPLGDLLDPAAYGRVVDSFCSNGRLPGVSRAGMYQRAMMLLSLHLALTSRKPEAGR